MFRVIDKAELNPFIREILERVESVCWHDVSLGRDAKGKWFTDHNDIPCLCGVADCDHGYTTSVIKPHPLRPEMLEHYASIMTAVNYIEHKTGMVLALHDDVDTGLPQPSFEIEVDPISYFLDQGD